MEVITKSEKETFELAYKIASELGEKRIICLNGELGAGKTVFVKGFCSFFGISEIWSPTFTIVNEYEGKIPLFHFDMYRLSDSDDLFDIGWEDYLARNGVCAVEWSERISDALPEDTLYVTISRHPENEGWRIITMEGDSTK